MDDTGITRTFAAMILSEMKRDKTFEDEMYQIIMHYYFPDMPKETVLSMIRFLTIFKHSTGAQLVPMFEAMLPDLDSTIQLPATPATSAQDSTATPAQPKC